MRAALFILAIVSGLPVLQGCEPQGGNIDPEHRGGVAQAVPSSSNSGATATTATSPPATQAAKSAHDESESEVVTSTDASGVRTTTRTFKNNPRIARIVVTTMPDGKQQVKVYASDGQVRDLPDDKATVALEASVDRIADMAGIKQTREEILVRDRASGDTERAKNMSAPRVRHGDTIGERTAVGPRTIGPRAAERAKKASKAVKNAVTP